MILTQILIYTIYNTLCGSDVFVHCFIRKAIHSLTGARVISIFSVRIDTAAIVFKWYIVSMLNFIHIDMYIRPIKWGCVWWPWHWLPDNLSVPSFVVSCCTLIWWQYLWWALCYTSTSIICMVFDNSNFLSQAYTIFKGKTCRISVWISADVNIVIVNLV